MFCFLVRFADAWVGILSESLRSDHPPGDVMDCLDVLDQPQGLMGLVGEGSHNRA